MSAERLREGVAHAAVMYRQDADWQAQPTRNMSAEDVFALRYESRTSN